MSVIRVVIVGGSVAGLECAIRLSDFAEVTLFEEHEEIGYPLRCAEGWISYIEPYIQGRMIDLATFRVLDDCFEISSEITVPSIVQVIDRPKMEKKMAKMAEKNGAEIITGVRVRIKDLSGFDLVVDASGFPAQIDKEMGLKRRPAVALQAFVDDDFDRIVIDFTKLTDGYFWQFPSFNGGGKVGVGFWKKKCNLRKLLEKYLSKHGFSVVGFTGGMLGVGVNRPLVRRYRGSTVCLVGDAAGLVDPFFAEGMTKAIISARILSDCVREGRIHEYEKRLLGRLRWHYLMSNILYKLKNANPKLCLLSMNILKFIYMVRQRFTHEEHTCNNRRDYYRTDDHFLRERDERAILPEKCVWKMGKG